MSKKLVKVVITEIYDDFSTVTYHKDYKQIIKDKVQADNFGIVVNTTRSWDVNNMIKIPLKSELMQYFIANNIAKTRIYFMNELFEGVVDTRGRIYSLSKMYKLARDNNISLESVGKVKLSYDIKNNIIALEK